MEPLYNYVKGLYDYAVIALYLFINTLEGLRDGDPLVNKVIQVLRQIQQSHLDDLDPEGVQELAGLYANYIMYIMAMHCYGTRYRGHKKVIYMY